MATQHAVLTVLGGDRPGLVDEVSAFVLECGANLEDSRMVNLRGQFAIMMLVAGSEAVMVRLRDKLGTLRRDGGVHAELTDAEVDQPCTVGATIPYRLTTTAMDHPGLMQSIAHLLRAMNVNIESADTTLRCAPVSGTPLFEMEMVLSVPPGTPVAELCEAVGRVADDLNMDWELAAL
jgi:glycine cleavage system transcriptional repressor